MPGRFAAGLVPGCGTGGIERKLITGLLDLPRKTSRGDMATRFTVSYGRYGRVV